MKKTHLILIAAALVLSAIDVYFAVNSVPGDTYSEVIFKYSVYFRAIPFAAGVICGHLFWGQKDKK